MDLAPSVLDMNWTDIEDKVKRFISDYVEKTRTNGIVLGLSGGIDSCTAGALAALAIGGSHVLGLMLPEEETRNATDIKHARLVAQRFELKTELCDITQTLRASYGSIPGYDGKNLIAKGNLKARTRTMYIYYYANKLNMLTCGCSDKSETMMGYFTKWGDMAADISPLMDLYKTQVRRLAKHVGIPTQIIAKPSTPALWRGQLAEAELGIEYETLDLILFGLEHFLTNEEIAQQLKIGNADIAKVRARWLSMEHKRRMPLTPKLEYRTVGTDFRLKR